MDMASDNEDSDNDIEVEESGSSVEVEDNDNHVVDEGNDMIYVQDLLINLSIDDVEHGQDS